MKEIVYTLITTMVTVLIMFIFVSWADRRRERDQLNEKTRFPKKWDDDDFLGWS